MVQTDFIGSVFMHRDFEGRGDTVLLKNTEDRNLLFTLHLKESRHCHTLLPPRLHGDKEEDSTLSNIYRRRLVAAAVTSADLLAVLPLLLLGRLFL